MPTPEEYVEHTHAGQLPICDPNAKRMRVLQLGEKGTEGLQLGRARRVREQCRKERPCKTFTRTTKGQYVSIWGILRIV